LASGGWGVIGTRHTPRAYPGERPASYAALRGGRSPGAHAGSMGVRRLARSALSTRPGLVVLSFDDGVPRGGTRRRPASSAVSAKTLRACGWTELTVALRRQRGACGGCLARQPGAPPRGRRFASTSPLASLGPRRRARLAGALRARAAGRGAPTAVAVCRNAGTGARAAALLSAGWRSPWGGKASRRA